MHTVRGNGIIKQKQPKTVGRRVSMVEQERGDPTITVDH